jgi:ABC-type polysaccharide/polyol phosphate transport system ATPase subunit
LNEYNDNAIIDLDSVSVRYRLAAKKITSLKEYAISHLTGKISYEHFNALDNVSLQVNRAEVVGLVGLNGAGKSTLLKLIAGVIRPSKGRVRVNGRVSPLLELGAGFNNELSGRENIFINGLLLGYSRSYIQENLEKIIAYAELEDFADVPIKNYSSGMRARLGFAIATQTEPEILIVDEVLAVGDGRFKKKSEGRMKDLIKSEATVLFVSHSLAQVRMLCDRVVWIERGKIRMTGEAETVCDAYEESL